MLSYISVFVIVFAGAFVQGVTGFGSAMIWMSFLPLVIPQANAAALVPLLLLLIGIYMSIKLFKNILWKVAIIPLVVSMVAAYFGKWLLGFTTTHTMQIVLGAGLLLLGVYLLITLSHPIKIKPTPVAGGIAGFVAGTFTGLLNIGGPPLAIYYTAATEEPMQFKACLEFNFLVMYGVTAVTYFFDGAYASSVMSPVVLIVAIVSVVVGSLAGLKLFGKFDKKLVSKLVYGMLVVMGAFQLCKAFGIF